MRAQAGIHASPKACCRTESTSRSSSVRCPRRRGSIASSPRYSALRYSLLSISAITAPIECLSLFGERSSDRLDDVATRCSGRACYQRYLRSRADQAQYLNDKLGLGDVEAERNSQPRARTASPSLSLED